MKIANIFVAAGLAVSALGVATAADARDWNNNGRPDSVDRHHQQDRRWDNGNHRGWNKHHVRCHTEWRHHHRVRICR